MKVDVRLHPKRNLNAVAMATSTLEGMYQHEIECTQQHEHKLQSSIDGGSQFLELYREAGLFVCVVKGEG